MLGKTRPALHLLVEFYNDSDNIQFGEILRVDGKVKTERCFAAV
jgi:hypothetical protein